MFWKMHLQQDPRFSRWYRRVEGRPGWVWTATLGAAAAVIVVPLVLLTLAALLVAAAVFAVLSLVAAGLRFIHRLGASLTGQGTGQRRWPAPFEPDDGRRNVRVIDRS
ncbi:MAG: hypothetical protein WD534_02110 [Phycisphaeraceae bacterium]